MWPIDHSHMSFPSFSRYFFTKFYRIGPATSRVFSTLYENKYRLEETGLRLDINFGASFHYVCVYSAARRLLGWLLPRLHLPSPTHANSVPFDTLPSLLHRLCILPRPVLSQPCPSCRRELLPAPAYLEVKASHVAISAIFSR